MTPDERTTHLKVLDYVYNLRQLQRYDDSNELQSICRIFHSGEFSGFTGDIIYVELFFHEKLINVATVVNIHTGFSACEHQEQEKINIFLFIVTI